MSKGLWKGYPLPQGLTHQPSAHVGWVAVCKMKRRPDLYRGAVSSAYVARLQRYRVLSPIFMKGMDCKSLFTLVSKPSIHGCTR